MIPRSTLASICLALSSSSLSTSYAQDQPEPVEQFKCTEMLFKSGWFKEMDEDLSQMLTQDNRQPVIIIHKRNPNSVDARRTIAIIPITEHNGDHLLGAPRITGYVVRIASQDPRFKPISKEFKADAGKWLEDIWLRASGLAVHASYGSDEEAAPTSLSEGNEYHVFTTFRQSAEIFHLSGHMMFFLTLSKVGSQRQALEANIEDLLKKLEADKDTDE